MTVDPLAIFFLPWEENILLDWTKMFDLEYCDQKYLGGYIVLKYILSMLKWLDIFEACHTGRKCFSHVTLLRNILAMSHSQNIS